MNPALYVIAILGCGEGEASCQPVETIDARYESRESCLAATQDALGRFSSLDFPVVLAECRRGGERALAPRGREVELPPRDQRPNAWRF